MKFQYGGPISVADLYQTIYQDEKFHREHGIQLVKAVNLYFTPCDDYGSPYAIYDAHGNLVEGLNSRKGPYKPVADFYDAGSLESETTYRAPQYPKLKP